jgi:hypothetical protein
MGQVTRDGAEGAPRRRRRLLDAPKLTRLDQLNEDVPLLFLEDGRVGVLADPDLVTLDDDFRAGDALRAERDDGFLHDGSPPFPSMVSMCGQTMARRRRPFVERHEARMPRTPASVPSRSDAFCSSNARMWAHGAAPARRSATI